MTRIKLCGMSRKEDIDAANRLAPEYIGFVFAKGSRRYVPPERALELKKHLRPDVSAVGVFVNEDIENIASLLEMGAIDIAQLHGSEDENYVKALRAVTDKPIIKAFRIDSAADIELANNSSADYVLLDSGAGGTGVSFKWELLEFMARPYFLAGGLNIQNVTQAVAKFSPYAVDVSSGIETDGVKDREKMIQFVRSVRLAEGKEFNAI